jgi:aryl-alcohol dehydrogenase-like predicted oxidoreductase
MIQIHPNPKLVFGCMQFGGNADVDASRAMFDACLDAGVTYFDTANGYNDGASEQLLGQFLQTTTRDCHVASKVGYVGGAGPQNLQKQLDQSRNRLQKDCIDLVYLHRFDPDTPLADTLTLFAKWQQTGQIRQIGLSNFAAWQVMKAQVIANRLGTQIDAIQPMYSLVKRQAEVEILPMAADTGVQVFAYSPLGGGLLSGKYSKGSGGRLTQDSRYAARYAPSVMHQTAQNLSLLAQAHAQHPATLAVAWVCAHVHKPIPIISARNVDQLQPSLAALNYTLSPALYAEISALSPTPAPATDRLEEA